MIYEFPHVYEILTFYFLLILSKNERKCDKILIVVTYFYSYQINVTYQKGLISWSEAFIVLF